MQEETCGLAWCPDFHFLENNASIDLMKENKTSLLGSVVGLCLIRPVRLWSDLIHIESLAYGKQ